MERNLRCCSAKHESRRVQVVTLRGAEGCRRSGFRDDPGHRISPGEIPLSSVQRGISGGDSGIPRVGSPAEAGFGRATAGFGAGGHPRQRDSAPGSTPKSGIRRRGAP